MWDLLSLLLWFILRYFLWTFHPIKMIFNIWIHNIIISACLYCDIKHKGSISRDWTRTFMSVSNIWWACDCSLISWGHLGKSNIPAFNHLSHTNIEFEIYILVESVTIWEVTFVSYSCFLSIIAFWKLKICSCKFN